MAEKYGVSSVCCDLISKMLDKSPETRITIPDIRRHDWLQLTFDRDSCINDIWKDEDPEDLSPCKLISVKENTTPITITDNDVERAVTRLPNLSTLVRIKQLRIKSRSKTTRERATATNPFPKRKSFNSLTDRLVL